MEKLPEVTHSKLQWDLGFQAPGPSHLSSPGPLTSVPSSQPQVPTHLSSWELFGRCVEWWRVSAASPWLPSPLLPLYLLDTLGSEPQPLPSGYFCLTTSLVTSPPSVRPPTSVCGDDFSCQSILEPSPHSDVDICQLPKCNVSIKASGGSQFPPT